MEPSTKIFLFRTSLAGCLTCLAISIAGLFDIPLVTSTSMMYGFIFLWFLTILPTMVIYHNYFSKLAPHQLTYGNTHKGVYVYLLLGNIPKSYKLIFLAIVVYSITALMIYYNKMPHGTVTSSHEIYSFNDHGYIVKLNQQEMIKYTIRKNASMASLLVMGFALSSLIWSTSHKREVTGQELKPF